MSSLGGVGGADARDQVELTQLGEADQGVAAGAPPQGEAIAGRDGARAKLSAYVHAASIMARLGELAGTEDAGAAKQLAGLGEQLCARLGELAKGSPEKLRQILAQAFPKASGAELDALIDRAKQGELPLPANVRFVDAEALRGANAAYSPKDGGTIFLSRDLEGDPEALQAAFDEEVGHHLDQVLGDGDSVGDEGEVFQKGLAKGAPLDAETLAAAKSDRDAGVIEVDGERVPVEFQKPSAWQLERVVKRFSDGLSCSDERALKALVPEVEKWLDNPATSGLPVTALLTYLSKGDAALRRKLANAMLEGIGDLKHFTGDDLAEYQKELAEAVPLKAAKQAAYDEAQGAFADARGKVNAIADQLGAAAVANNRKQTPSDKVARWVKEVKTTTDPYDRSWAVHRLQEAVKSRCSLLKGYARDNPEHAAWANAQREKLEALSGQLKTAYKSEYELGEEVPRARHEARGAASRVSQLEGCITSLTTSLQGLDSVAAEVKEVRSAAHAELQDRSETLTSPASGEPKPVTGSDGRVQGYLIEKQNGHRVFVDTAGKAKFGGPDGPFLTDISSWGPEKCLECGMPYGLTKSWAQNAIRTLQGYHDRADETYTSVGITGRERSHPEFADRARQVLAGHISEIRKALNASPPDVAKAHELYREALIGTLEVDRDFAVVLDRSIAHIDAAITTLKATVKVGEIAAVAAGRLTAGDAGAAAAGATYNFVTALAQQKDLTHAFLDALKGLGYGLGPSGAAAVSGTVTAAESLIDAIDKSGGDITAEDCLAALGKGTLSGVLAFFTAKLVDGIVEGAAPKLGARISEYISKNPGRAQAIAKFLSSREGQQRVKAVAERVGGEGSAALEDAIKSMLGSIG